jgi:tRNA U34 5-methylaminomethyl-2-thiouridine-forming methyltransferase MnmC
MAVGEISEIPNRVPVDELVAVGYRDMPAPAHDPEKWTPVFLRDKRDLRLRGDHAQSII